MKHIHTPRVQNKKEVNMITDSFDTSDVFISPEKLLPRSSVTLDVCIGIFSHKVMNELISSGDLTKLPMERICQWKKCCIPL